MTKPDLSACRARVSTIERAFQLARMGEAGNLTDISVRLNREGYLEVEQHLQSPLLRQQLRAICRQPRSPAD